MTKTTRRFAIGAGILLGVGVVFLAEEHIRGALELHAWQRAMRAKGEKLTIAELTPVITNLASRVIAPGEAAGLLGRATAPQDCPTAMQIVAPGKARVAWALSNWRSENGSRFTNDWNAPSLASAFRSLREVLPALRSDLTNRAFIIGVDYEQGFDPRLMHAHVVGYYKAAHALRADTVLALHEHRLDEATENLVAGAALVRLMKEERFMKSHLLCHVATELLQGATWETLQADGWTDAQLSAIQAGWESPDLIESLLQAYGMERAMSCTYYYDRDRCSNRKLIETVLNPHGLGSINPGRASENLLTELLGGLDDASKPVRAKLEIAVWRLAWADQDQLVYCESVQRLIDSGRRAVAGRKSPLGHPPGTVADDDPLFSTIGLPPMSAYNRMRYLLTPWIFFGTQEQLQKAIQAETVRELTLAAVALKRYQLRHGRLPEKLTALVPEIVREVPRDWYNGQSLHYRPNADGSYLLYSVGEDGRDDGGDPTPRDQNQRTARFYSGRDLVWPMPATPEEVKAAEVRKR